MLPPGCLSLVGICDHSTLTGTLAGTASVVVTAFVPSLDAGSSFANSTAVVHTATGDLQLTESAAANLLPDSPGEFASLFEVTAAPERFVGASGYFTAYGTSTIALLGSPVLPCLATGHGEYVGTVQLA